MLNTFYSEFLGNSPRWFKTTILAFLIACYPLTLLLGKTIMGWAFIAMFIMTLALALKCYPLQSGGLLALAVLIVWAATLFHVGPHHRTPWRYDIPGAVFADLDADLSGTPSEAAGRHPLPTPIKFAEAMGRLGIGDRTRVVVYDSEVLD